jgi:hypothetical protein
MPQGSVRGRVRAPHVKRGSLGPDADVVVARGGSGPHEMTGATRRTGSLACYD